jgi:hypothetical protein
VTSDAPWTLVHGSTRLSPGGSEWHTHQFTIRRRDQTRRIVVWIARAAAERAELPLLIRRAVETDGRSVVERALWLDDPPTEIRVDEERIYLPS